VNPVPFHNQAGTDGMRVDGPDEWCRIHQDELIASLMDGSYQPQPVKGG
jgi:RNA-directed DNA polymerase